MTEEWWQEHGYLAGKPIGGGLWICVARMLFTDRLLVCDEGSVYDFYCYEDRPLALEAFDLWDGTGEPLPGWTRHHDWERPRA